MASTSENVIKDLESALREAAEKESRFKLNPIHEGYDDFMEVMNEMKHELRAVEDYIIKRLKEVQLSLREIQGERNEDKAKQKKEIIYSCYNAGKPYFKDSNFDQPPPNEDTQIMKQCDMYDFSTVMTMCGWTVGDTSNLRKVLLRIAQERETNRLYSQLALLRRIKPKNSMIQAKIDQIMFDISNMKYKTLSDLDPSSYENFDWDDVALELNRDDHRRHSAREYKALWKLLLQPSIKMDKWTATEHLHLQRLAREYKMQNWNAIAKELNVSRTGYQCFVYYRTNMDHAASGRRWTMDEMDKLRDVIIAHQEENHIPWGKVAALMPNRTKVQCYNKFTRMFERRKGRFCDEEDAVILNYVNVFGAQYKNMAQLMFGRSTVQIRNRHYLLKRAGTSATWTETDDEKLLLAIANSDGPCTYSMAARQFGPGKERTHLRSRYHTLKNWIKKHPHCPTRNAPRRAPRRLPHGEPTTNLITALTNLRLKINELTNEPVNQGPKPRNNNRLCRASSHAALNSALRTHITGYQMKMMTGATDSSLFEEEETVEHIGGHTANGTEETHRGIEPTNHRQAETKPSALVLQGAGLLQQNLKKDTMQVRSSDTVQTLPIRDIVSAQQSGQDVYHLNLLLYVLNTKIADKDKFQSSELGRGFKELEELEKQGLVKKDQCMKSYSRKGSMEAEEVIYPNLYDGTIAGRRKFLLPPNLATLTASRVLLSHVHKQLQLEKESALPEQPQDFDLKRTLRRKPMARQAIIELRERFNDLFVWPYNLSNNAPRYYSAMEQETEKKRATVPPKRVAGVVLPGVPMVTIPPAPPKRMRIRAWQRKGITLTEKRTKVVSIDMDEKEMQERMAETKVLMTPLGESEQENDLKPADICIRSVPAIPEKPVHVPVNDPVISEKPVNDPVISEKLVNDPVISEGHIRLPVNDAVISEGPIHLPVNDPVISEGPIHLTVNDPVISEGPIRLPVNDPVISEGSIRLPVNDPVISDGPVRLHINDPVISEGPIRLPVNDPAISEEPVHVSGI